MLPIRVKVAIAAALAVGGFVLFHQNHQPIDLVLAIAGLLYLYIRWHLYKRSQYQARRK